MLTVLLIILILALVGALPAWGIHTAGYYPSGAILLVIVILLLFFLRR